MAMFQYRILEDSGRVSKGRTMLPFDDVAPAIRHLERQGGVVLSIAPLNRISLALVRARRSLRRVKRKELAVLLHNLAGLLAQGIPVSDALARLGQRTENPTLLKVLDGLRTDMETGLSLCQAMARQGGVFSPLVLSMCRLGEEKGRLDKMLVHAAEHLLHMSEIVESSKRALVYPGILFGVALGAACYWFLAVVPQLINFFDEMGVALPFATRILLEVASFFREVAPIFLCVAGGGVISLLLTRLWLPSSRHVLDSILLRIPVLKVVVETALVARVSEYMGILISSGLGVARSLDITLNSVGNIVYQQRVLDAREGVRNGLLLSDAMRRARVLQPFAARMMAISEQHGKLGDQAIHVATLYRERLANLSDGLCKSLEPVMFVFLGLMFAMIIIGLLPPMYAFMA